MAWTRSTHEVNAKFLQNFVRKTLLRVIYVMSRWLNCDRLVIRMAESEKCVQNFVRTTSVGVNYAIYRKVNTWGMG